MLTLTILSIGFLFLYFCILGEKVCLLLLCIFFLNACATKNLVEYESGDLIAAHKNIKKTPEPSEYNISLEKLSDDIGLQVSIVKNDPVNEEWEDIYSKIGLYETRCKAWKDPDFFVPGTRKYCEFDTSKFLLSHVLVLGFFYDMAIPFKPYGPPISSKETEEDIISKKESRVVNVETPVDAKFIKLTINNISSSSPASGGVAQFNFKTLKLKSDKLPADATVSIDFDGHHIDASAEFAAIVEKGAAWKIALEQAQANRKIVLQEAKDAEQRRPETKYKMNFCSNPNLFDVVFMSTFTLESNCIYTIGAAPLKVLQAVDGGILVTPTVFNSSVLDKVIYIRTKKSYVDGDLVQSMYLKSVGPIKYESVMGAGKTVHAFQYLGNLYSDHRSNN